jgi:hypothetical protein
MSAEEYLFECGGVKWNWWLISSIFLFVPLVKLALLLVTTIVKQFLPMPELLKKYCSNSKRSWAVVTGATDGIGLGFCEVFTTLGFNVVLISRNPEKLKKTEEYLQTLRPAQYSTSKLKTIAFNFKDSADSTKWSELIS